MTEAVETSTFMEGAASKSTVPVQREAASWKPQQERASPPPKALEAPPKVEVEEEQEEVCPPQEEQEHGEEQTEVESPLEKDEARRRMALFQAQRLLLAARPFDSIEYFYVQNELKYYLRLGDTRDFPDEEDDEEHNDQVGRGWWRWIMTLLCGGDASRDRTTTTPILV